MDMYNILIDLDLTQGHSVTVL